MGRWDSSTYGVYGADNNVTYFDSDLKKIVSDNNAITPLYDGWFYYAKGGDVTVFKGDKMYTFEDITGINSISNGLAVVYKNDSSTWQEGLMTLDGKVMIPMANNQSIYLITSKKSGEAFAIASSYDSIQSFKVYNSGGEILFSGNGYASFNTQYDMFEVNNELSFAYIDTAGRDVF